MEVESRNVLRIVRPGSCVRPSRLTRGVIAAAQQVVDLGLVFVFDGLSFALDSLLLLSSLQG